MTTDSILAFAPPMITPVDTTIEQALRARIDGKAKPPGSLGRIEELAVELGLMRHPHRPRADKAVLLVFAGDHGLTAEGVSQYPSEVTVAMVMTYLAGKACANAFATATGVDVRVIDAGVAAELPDHPGLIDAKVRMGTANAARESAMTADEATLALLRGIGLAIAEIQQGAELIALGEMGIGNTASSSLILHRLGPAPLDQSIGIGAGQDAEGMAKKRAAIEMAAARSAASKQRPVIVDGFIATAAALVAVRLAPHARGYCIFAHRSAERGHDLALQALHANPLLDLRLRLGEGTGAILAVPLVRAAARLVTDVADLADVLAGRL